MARYIDADLAIEQINQVLKEKIDEKHSTGYFALEKFKEALEVAPTANVAPMEEVERLQTICDSYIVQYGTVAHKEVLLKKERADTAREIFEEIESISSDFPLYGNTNTVILSERDLAFIKKKYTEGL